MCSLTPDVSETSSPSIFELFGKKVKEIRLNKWRLIALLDRSSVTKGGKLN
jgi:hypothetical protein